jgi:hypothetical protein
MGKRQPYDPVHVIHDTIGIYDFKPLPDERAAYQDWRRRKALLNQLDTMRARWDREDWTRIHDRAAQIAAAVERDRQNGELEERRNAVDRWWAAERAKDKEAMERLVDAYQNELDANTVKQDKARLAALGKILENIQRDNARAEREELTWRGVVRGRRK